MKRYLIAAFLVAVIMCSVCLARPQTNSTVLPDEFIREHFRAAKLAEAGGDLSKAEYEYRLILHAFPTQVPRVYQNLGLDYYLQRNYSDAVAAFSRGLTLDRTMVGAQLFIGSSYLYLGEPQKALPHLKFAYGVKPTANASMYLGEAYQGLGKLTLAATYLKHALDTAEQNRANYLYLLGDNYLQLANQISRNISERFAGSFYDHLVNAEVLDGQGWFQSAAREYLYAATKDPTDASVFYSFARVLARLGLQAPAQLSLGRYRRLMPVDTPSNIDAELRPEKELADVGIKVNYVRAIGGLPAIEPANLPLLPLAPAEVNRALRREVLEDKRGFWRKATNELCHAHWSQAVQTLRECSPRVHGWLRTYLIAEAYFWDRDYQRAEDQIDEGLLPFHSVAAVQLLRWEVAKQLSLIYLNQLVEDYPNECRAHFVKARTYVAQGKQRDALEEYRAAIKTGPSQLGIHLALADLYRSDQRFPQALQQYQKELLVDPYSTAAMHWIGRIYLDLNQPTEAMPYLKSVLQLDPVDAQGHADIAHAWELLGNKRMALQEYKQALKLDPGLNRLHYVLALLYRKLGERELMKQEFELFQQGEENKQHQTLERVTRYREAQKGSGRHSDRKP